MNKNNTKAYPGMILGKCTDLKASTNTYAYLGNIYAN